jgi:hypothetical protein
MGREGRRPTAGLGGELTVGATAAFTSRRWFVRLLRRNGVRDLVRVELAEQAGHSVEARLYFDELRAAIRLDQQLESFSRRK